MFGINGGELLVLLVVAAVVIGPERLPGYAEQLGQWVRRARQFVQDTKQRVDEELGEEARSVDWASLDPRKYDPRRIVREALLDDVTKPVSAMAGAGAAVRDPSPATGDWRRSPAPVGAPGTPFDDEAT
ncbi:twin-arginine translocase TatA/TatE family subunit [Cellulomonas alba]|uniref:Twin-arginine translocase TatA/TatE family subunit n=1 Tax=Cellulomonas alba TaxID=3053467 RepID=A0ABT7SHN0_9CELL|nr:twin-arginine translocase TatA/TatE family subunit [Cellulomonas alba]MDM7855681.1 twin-arginine translocase TatA/TatE family subunit [Cellulomonas alba]